MAEHKHGSMDITVQEKTFNGMMKFTYRFVVAVIITLVLLALLNG